MLVWSLACLALCLLLLATGRLDGARLGTGLGAVLLAVDDSSEDFYLASWNDEGIYRLRGGSSEPERVAAIRCRPLALAWSAARGELDFACSSSAREPRIYALNSRSGRVDRVDLLDLFQAAQEKESIPFRSEFVVTGLAAEPSGDLLVTLAEPEPDLVNRWLLARISLAGSKPEIVARAAPLAGVIPIVRSWRILSDPVEGRVYLARAFTSEVLVFDQGLRLLTRIPLTSSVSDIALTNGGRSLAVADMLRGSLALIDTKSWETVARTRLGTGIIGIWASEREGLLYAIERYDDSLRILDAASLDLRCTVPLRRPLAIAGSEALDRIAVSSDDAPGLRVFPSARLTDACAPRATGDARSRSMVAGG